MFKKEFKRPGGFNDRRSGGRDAGRAEMYPATCSRCGKACEVPFRPNGRKPVYCRDCFGAERNAPGNFAPQPYSRERSPRGNAPAFRPEGEDTELAALKRQVAAMNVKVDTMLRILESGTRGEAPHTEAATPKAPSKTDIQESIRKDLVKKRAVKKAKGKKRI